MDGQRVMNKQQTKEAIEIMTPLYLEIMIHYNSSCLPFPRKDAPAVQECLEDMKKKGLIVFTTSEGIFKASNMLRAHIKNLCSIPLPTETFLTHDNKIIKLEK